MTSIDVTAIGAAGGNGAAPTGGGGAGTGGEGEAVSSTLAVIPGSTLYVEVGGVGGAGTTSAGGAVGFNAGTGSGANTAAGGAHSSGATGGGGGGGGGSSFAGTDLGATASAAEVSISYTSPQPAGTSDLKVFLKHQGVFQHHRLGSYGIWVTNTGTAATTTAHPIVVTLDTGAGIQVTQGGKGTDWQCHKAGRATSCTRSAPLGAGKRTMITVTVWVNTRTGKTRHATAAVSPSGPTGRAGLQGEHEDQR